MSKKNKHKVNLHNFIPGGSHTYSKGDDQFPSNAPKFIIKGKGSYVWTEKNKKYLDCSFGLSSVTLGHAFSPIIKKVKKELNFGSNFQRPSIKEYDAAKQFLDLVPFHDRIKFAKNGSTLTTAAVKLARAKTNRPFVAVPSNHSFYSYDDWYIGITKCNRGVPKQISKLTKTFIGCDIKSLKNLFKKYRGKIACVITEPELPMCNRTCECKKNVKDYLKEVSALTKAEGSILIIDEMVTGFKSSFPGSAVKFGIRPDMITWGKSISNGFSFSALTGSKEVMDLGSLKKNQSKVFLISTTHGAETHSIVAAQETISFFKKKRVVEYKKSVGKYFIASVQKLIHKHNLSNYIKIIECDWFPQFIFYNKRKKICNGMKTVFLQEMIRRKILFQGYFIPSYSHNKLQIKKICNAIDHSLGIYKMALSDGFKKYLKGHVVKPVFRKFN